jgi:cbb3-type cytochrome oxidase maturation protein
VDVVILLIFISLVLVVAGLVFFTYRLRAGDFDHGERLALAPLEEDDAAPDTPDAAPQHEDDSPENPEGGTLNDGS